VPILNNHTVFEIAWGLKVFFGLRAGLTRGAVPDYGLQNKSSERIAREIADKDRQIDALKRKLVRVEGDHLLIDAAKLTWIFGTARVGSTWLGAMMEDLKDHSVWHEPIVGRLFGDFYYDIAEHRRGEHFIMGNRYRRVWLKSIRELVLSGATARFPEVKKSGHLIVKEPNGSIGAPLLMEALPESRMIFLVRDPRDVAASALDASRKGSWLSERRGEREKGRSTRAEDNPNSIVKIVAKRYMQYVGNTTHAYKAHKGPKLLVRYETLRADTLAEMKRIHQLLDIPVDDGELAEVVKKRSWESIPEEEKGAGKFYRKATPGGWREDLTREQIALVERITAPLLDQLYPGSRTTA
jgi:hypothetical protein